MALEEQIYMCVNISEFEIGEEKVSRQNKMAGETIAYFEEHQVVQFGWMMENAKRRTEKKSKEVVQCGQTAQSFKYQVLGFWS